jgi:hypothetical protein
MCRTFLKICPACPASPTYHAYTPAYLLCPGFLVSSYSTEEHGKLGWVSCHYESENCIPHIGIWQVQLGGELG